ncbi:MAG: hypothetical protein KH828_07860 [Clostridiales bacterium]|nr:hypothetical protein [Clostridiales bacterium]
MQLYVGYQYYAETYNGTMIPEEFFPKAAREASAFIREITHDMIVEVTDDIRDAACGVAEVYYSEDNNQGEGNDHREVKSENTDGYSISYVTEGKDGESREETVRRKMYLAARKYLIHTGLLYAGWYDGD